MRALVTGGTGFLGGHLIDKLLQYGDTITALVRSLDRAAPLRERGVKLIQGDLHSHEALLAAAAEQDVIYHAAALTGAVNEAEFMRANRDGTGNLVAAAERSGTNPRLVLISSMAAGGPARRGVAKSDDSADAPVTMYGRSKAASERLVRDSRLPWTILRPPTIYGPRDRDNLLVIFRAARHGWVPVFGNGSMELSVVEVGDLAEAIVLSGKTDSVLGRTWYVNHPEVLTTARLAQEVGRALGRDRINLLHLPRWATAPILTATGIMAELFRYKTILRADKVHEFYQEAWTGNVDPFMTATGWVPQYDFSSGAVATATWYRQEGWL